MKTKHNILAAAALTVAGLTPAHAIVINGTYGAANALALAAPFSNVVRINIDTGAGAGVCSGSMISATTILTAKHCTAGLGIGAFTVDFDRNGNGNIADFGDSRMTVSGKFEAPNPGTNANLIDGTDLAMLTLSGPAPGWASSYQLWTGDILGAQVTTVGYGGQGVNSLVAGTAGGTRWAAQNIVDKVGSGGFNQPFSTNIISTDFDNGTAAGNTLGGFPINSSEVPLAAEGTTAGGDSGGPLFFNLNNAWYIGGVLSGGSDGTSSAGDISWWTGVTAFRAEIELAGGVFLSPIPEPSSYAMALLGLVMLGALKKRRQADC